MANLILEQDNFAKKATLLTRTLEPGSKKATLVLFAQSLDSWALRAYGTGRGAGVFGLNDAAVAEACGVYGWSTGGAIGVVGEAQDEPAKKEGRKEHGIGVFGRGPDFGVHAQGGYAGVSGVSERTGVEGSGVKNAGVYGFSLEGTGVVGDSSKGHAGRFYGDVRISGDLDVQGTKSAVVPFPDGSLRRLYCQESPESWFEDFGEGKLVNGRALVSLDEGFAGVIRDDYHVFLTPQADCNGLFVSARRRGEFEVQESRRGTHTLHFSYRVVARRKDVASPRFEKVQALERPQRPTAPDIPHPNPEDASAKE